MKRSKLLALIFVGLMLVGCVSQGAPEVTVPDSTPVSTPLPTPAPTSPPVPEDPVQLLLDSLTLEEKVGQLFMVRPESLNIGNDQTDVTDRLLQQYPVGGIMIAGSNIVNEEQIVAFNEAFQKASKVPLLISTDEEGGIVARFANHKAFSLPKYESANAVGASGNAADAVEMGATIGAYLKNYGVNMDLAPVADVNTNPNNPVIGTRAFSSDAAIAAQMANGTAAGLQQAGIIPTYKHFPGHGDTAEDSHSRLAVSYKTEEELLACEWLPYKELGADRCVMVAHVALPNVTGNMTPATLSKEILQEILRQKLGFEGVIITDAMEMGAIANTYPSGEAAVLAIQAGCDMILCPYDFKAAYSAVLEAAKDGTLSQERIDESVYRILTLKQAYGLL